MLDFTIWQPRSQKGTRTELREESEIISSRVMTARCGLQCNGNYSYSRIYAITVGKLSLLIFFYSLNVICIKLFEVAG